MAERIRVTIPDAKPYDIIIETGLSQKLSERAAEFNLDGRVVVATDSTVAPLHAQTLADGLPNAALATMQAGETHKNLDTVRDYYDQLFDAKADRHTVLLACGGGVVGDTAGFVAASFMRGIRLVQMPTTLLSMVDSSVGGKVGVDVPQGKNLVGAFKQPECVLIDPDVLQTLPDEEWRAGMAEVIKHGFLADEGLLDPDLHQLSRAEELVNRAIKVKVEVVQEDPYEHGVRAYLNLGHTFAHAIERVTEFGWSHGDAVGFGLLAAATLSHDLDMCDTSLVEHVDSVVTQLGLPRRIGDLSPDAIYDAMTTDKKWKNGVSRFVLLEGMNKPTIREGIPREIVVKVLENLK